MSQMDRIRNVSNGLTNLQALREIFLVNERASFEWIVSHNSLREAQDKYDIRLLTWFWDIAHHSEVCLEDGGPTAESQALATRLNNPKFGYLSDKDRLLLQDAIFLNCQAFLTMENRLPKNSPHIKRELGILVVTPSTHWEMLRPWASLWR